MSDLLSTADLIEPLGMSRMDVVRMIRDGMIERPARYRKHVLLSWTRADARLFRVVARLDRFSPNGAVRRGSILGIDWTALGDLVRSHSEAGWLVIRDDGTLLFTESAEQAAEWQCSALLAVCVRVEAT